MGAAALPADEAGRIASLHALNVLDTDPEAEFDAIVGLASTFCETPMAFLSLVDTDRQWFKSRVGVDALETPRDQAFCAHAILEPDNVLVVPDAMLDDRFSDSPLVTGAPNIRFYAGAPLVTSDGQAIGTLCAIDKVPREMAPHQLKALRVAAHSVVMLLEKRRADARLHLLELVAVHASDGVAIVEMVPAAPESRRIEYINDAFTRLTGYSESEIRDGDIGRLLMGFARDRRFSMLAEATGSRQETVVDSARIVRKDGTKAEIEISLSHVISPEGDRVSHVVAILRDVTEKRRVELERVHADLMAVANTELQHEILERKRAELLLSHTASHDALTGLPNRTLFKQVLEATLASHRSGNTNARSAVVFIDLDRFKKINDTLGHLMGDALLIAVAARLRATVRADDIVSRFAGDEFTVLLADALDETDTAAIVDRLSRAFSEPFRLGASEVFVTASIGVAVVDAGHASAEDALRDADIAMFAAKQGGRSRAQFFNQELSARFAAVHDLETALFGALQQKEFRLIYQPIVSLPPSDQQLQGFEALVRWTTARGEIGPAQFIPAAEETGLIVPIGEWILNDACDRAAAWHSEFAGRLPHMPSVSVNVSAKQFMSMQFVEQVDHALQRSGIDPAYLALELTETTLMEDVEKGCAVIASLRERGIKIYLDDFGTGYCSFGYLRRFAVDRLKIDRSFISGGDDVTKTQRLADPEIVKAIISVAHSLGIQTIAEGVETDEQRTALIAMGCDAAQGYLFSRPVDDAAAILERAKRQGKARRTPARVA